MAAVELSSANPDIIPLLIAQRKRGRKIEINGNNRLNIVRDAFYDHRVWLDSKNIEYCFHIKNESNTVIFDFGRECDAVLFKLKWG